MITRSGSRERKGEEFTDNERRFIAGMKEVVSQHGSFNFSLDKVRIKGDNKDAKTSSR